jgi:fatty acid desaturase
MAHVHRAPSRRARPARRLNGPLAAAMTAGYLVCALALYAIAVFGEPGWVRPYVIIGLIVGYCWWMSIPWRPAGPSPDGEPAQSLHAEERSTPKSRWPAGGIVDRTPGPR